MSSQSVDFSPAARHTLSPLSPDTSWPKLYPGLRTEPNPVSRFRSTVRDRGYNLPQDRRKRPRGYDLLSAAREYAEWAHKGERLKYVHDVYITHPKAVSERMSTPREKAVAFLHDVVENRVTEILGKYDSEKHDYETYKADEEIVIRQTLDEITLYFQNSGCLNVADIIADINILTKRITDKDYDAYIDRLLKEGSTTAIKVKMADIEDNSLKSRNPPTNNQTPKDVKRLQKYKHAIEKIRARRPDIKLEPRREDRRNRRAERGRPLQHKKSIQRGNHYGWD